MKKIRKLLSVALVLCVVLTLVPVSASASGTKSIVDVAKSQVGVSGCPNTYTYWLGQIPGYSHNGYGYPWCAAFVSWCARQAGESKAVPATASVYVMYNSILKTGGKKISSPKSGDIVIYRRKADNYFAHVGIMENSSTSIEGNYGNAVVRGIKPGTYSDGAGSTVKNGRIEVLYLRPAYKNKNTGNTLKIQSEFVCDVMITSTKGQCVDLLSKPTDSKPKTYFDKGQTAYSTHGVKLSNGAVYYQIQALENGKVVTLWLKEGSKGTKIIDRGPSITFPVESLSLATGQSQTITISFVGDVYTLGYGFSDDSDSNSVATARWGNVDWKAGTATITVTARRGGSTSLDIYLWGEGENNLLLKQSVPVYAN